MRTLGPTVQFIPGAEGVLDDHDGAVGESDGGTVRTLAGALFGGGWSKELMVTSAFVVQGCSRSGPNATTMVSKSPRKGLEAIAVLRTKVDAQGTLWETVLPPEFLRLPRGLSQIDQLLDDPVFFEPVEEFFDPEIGRPSIRDGDLPAHDVPALQISTWLRDRVRRGGRLSRVAEVLPHRAHRRGVPPPRS
jgi:hypothetical protein